MYAVPQSLINSRLDNLKRNVISHIGEDCVYAAGDRYCTSPWTGAHSNISLAAMCTWTTPVMVAKLLFTTVWWLDHLKADDMVVSDFYDERPCE